MVIRAGYTGCGMRDVHVVTCFLLRRGEDTDEVLLLRRSGRVGTYRGRWAGVSGYLEAPSALEQAYREIEDEVGLGPGDVRLVAEGEPLIVPDESIDTRWTVHPFLFEMVTEGGEPGEGAGDLKVAPTGLLRLDWEHTESRWVRPQDVAGLETVPGLAEALARVYTDP
jgi:8-oxo-dGTP diphosphatase